MPSIETDRRNREELWESRIPIVTKLVDVKNIHCKLKKKKDYNFRRIEWLIPNFDLYKVMKSIGPYLIWKQAVTGSIMDW